MFFSKLQIFFSLLNDLPASARSSVYKISCNMSFLAYLVISSVTVIVDSTNVDELNLKFMPRSNIDSR